jgi:predicted site-specific integrase-resolvase
MCEDKQVRCGAVRLLVCHVARRLRVAQTTIRWWARTGKLQGRRISKKIWQFDEAEVDRFAASRMKRMEAASR